MRSAMTSDSSDPRPHSTDSTDSTRSTKGEIPERLWSAVDTAAFLGVPVSTLHQWRYLRTGPGVPGRPLAPVRPGRGRCLAERRCGLMGNVKKRPDGRWRARYRDTSGKEHARHFDLKRDADGWVEEQESAKRRGEWVDPALSRITFGEWSETWWDTKASLKPKTRATYASVLRARVLPRWRDVPLKAITHGDVVTWAAELRTVVGDSMTRQAVDILGQCLALAVRDGRLIRNVAEGVKRPKPERGRQRFLTHTEVDKLAAECPPPYGLLVRLLAYTGLRFGEAAGLRVRSVDLRRGRLEVVDNLTEADGRLYEGSPKARRTRSVPVPGSYGPSWRCTPRARTATSAYSARRVAGRCGTPTSGTTSSTRP